MPGLLLKELSRYPIGTFADVVYRDSLLYPDRTAFVCGSARVTFAEYNSRVNRLIRALHTLGLRKGDVVGILSWNCLEFADLYGAAMKGGLIASPFNPRLNPVELEYVIRYSGAKTLFLGPEFLEVVDRLRPRLPNVEHFISIEGSSPGMAGYQELLETARGEEPDTPVEEDDPVCIIYTSGTTGLPRGALYTHHRLMEDTKQLIMDLVLEQGETHVQITPLFHIAGSAFFRAFLCTGGCNVIMRSFDPNATLKAIQDERATHMMFVPTQLVAILALPDLGRYDLSSMKMMWYGGSPMPLEVLSRGIAAFGSIFGQGYGQSESGPGISHLSREDHKALNGSESDRRKLASAGRPDMGVQVRIVNEEGEDVEAERVGEIIVRSKQLMVEYWQKPEDTLAKSMDGWLRTGDMGFYDQEGYLYIADRKADMIISGGEHVYPREVEDVLYTHPAVLEAAVIGVPDPYWVERVHAVVVRRAEPHATAEELILYCKERLAGYKSPKSIEFLESMPKNAAGKILKRDLKKSA
ncbi:MAG: long-chain fatty acid--CoA ligase [Deltaproteobacteria bacterium HGW-Deltaproteobacteria-21]|nr:MAG: long-chain fatty acid--CoA ligase [Deltaproteobacteria bacterium HGW-Deltaproteobacteria-21]